MRERHFFLNLFRAKSTIPAHLGKALETAPLARSRSIPERCPREKGAAGGWLKTGNTSKRKQHRTEEEMRGHMVVVCEAPL